LPWSATSLNAPINLYGNMETVFRPLLLLITLLSTNFVFGAEWCAPGAPRHPPHPITGDTCAVVGKMGDIKLAIPSEYLLGPIAYKGIDVWNPDSYKNRPQQPTFDNEIDSFGIRIRQTDFKPIETENDQEAFCESCRSVRKLPPPNNRWLQVGFDGRRYPMDSARVVAERWHQMYARGPFDRQSDVWGLAHYVSSQLPSKDVAYGGGIQWEYFYDEQGTTFIDCQNTLRKVPPYDLITFCEIWFNAPKVRAEVNVGNIRDKADLDRWSEIETAVLRVLDSFIAK
jgi:hypothetical protein